MRDIKIVSAEIAKAVKACNGGRITTEAAKEAAAKLLASSKDPKEAIENAEVFMNLSALNQELERAGCVKTERTHSALMVAVRSALGITN